MISLTVGYVSGIIAAAVFILQFLVPNALIIILASALGNEHTAVTWSVVEVSGPEGRVGVKRVLVVVQE